MAILSRNIHVLHTNLCPTNQICACVGIISIGFFVLSCAVHTLLPVLTLSSWKSEWRVQIMKTSICNSTSSMWWHTQTAGEQVAWTMLIRTTKINRQVSSTDIVAVSRPTPPSSTGGQLINLIPFIICTAVCFGNFTRGWERSGTERGIKRDEGWYNDVTTGKENLATV